MDMQTLSGLYFLGVLFAVVLIVCWIVLPFAVIGAKPLLRELIREQRRTNELLEQVRRAAGPGVPPAKPLRS